MARTVPDTVRELLLSLPGTEEVVSHGMPNFKVGGKSFASFVINHHGDGRVGLWLAMPPGAQVQFVEMGSDGYFVPPYAGAQGWLGLDLRACFGGELSWDEVTRRVVEAWTYKAPARLAPELPERIDIAPPDTPLTAEEIDPMLRDSARSVMTELARRCERLPEVRAATEWGCPAWKAGKPSFVRANHREGRLKLQFWVGVEQQPFFTEDPRYAVPMYFGPKGWIELDAEGAVNWDEIDNLLVNSYRHFALKRMLKALNEAEP